MVTKTVEIESVSVQLDGQVHVVELTHYMEKGKVMSSRRDNRVIDVGDTVLVGEDQLVKDVINGNLHSAARKTARDAVKAAEAQPT